MKRSAALLVLLVLAGCSHRPPLQQDPEFLHYEYLFTGQLGSQTVSGSLSFDRITEYDIEYTVSSERGHCNTRMRRTMIGNLRLRCEGLSFDFTRSGVVRSVARATLVTTEPVERRECVVWAPRSGGSVCERWHNVLVDRPVVHHGTLRIEAHDPHGWSLPAER